MAEDVFLDRLVAYANERSFWWGRAQAMGFKLGPVSMDYWEGYGDYAMRGVFTCVCGRQEQYLFVLENALRVTELPQEFLIDLCDPALRLHNSGSFSRAHLLEDGYTEAQVQEIIAKGTVYDLEHDRLPFEPEERRAYLQQTYGDPYGCATQLRR